jgi:hypothetical protein
VTRGDPNEGVGRPLSTSSRAFWDASGGLRATRHRRLSLRSIKVSLSCAGLKQSMLVIRIRSLDVFGVCFVPLGETRVRLSPHTGPDLFIGIGWTCPRMRKRTGTPLLVVPSYILMVIMMVWVHFSVGVVLHTTIQDGHCIYVCGRAFA